MPVIDHWWQTETGWCIAGNPVGLGMLPVKHGSPTVAMPGYDIRVVDEGCHEVAANKMGSIVVKLPLPPACLPTLWQADERMRESYLDEFPGYYKTADAGFMDDDGYIYVMGRTDDIINVAGHRLSTGGMEEVLASHPDVAECAVLGIKDELKGEVPCGFIVLKSGVNRAADRDREGMHRAGARQDRTGGGVQAGDHGGAAAEDALGQDPARHDQEDRRRRFVEDAGDDRRSRGFGRDRRRVEGEGIWLMSYYLDLFTPETWAAFRKSGGGISGFRKKQRKSAERIKSGDIFLCYLVRVSRWCGVLQVTSSSFTDTSPIFSDPDPFVVRFRVKPQITLDLEQSIPMLDQHVWSQVSFTEGITRGVMGWAQFLNLRASLREINPADGKILQDMLVRLRRINRIHCRQLTNSASDSNLPFEL